MIALPIQSQVVLCCSTVQIKNSPCHYHPLPSYTDAFGHQTRSGLWIEQPGAEALWGLATGSVPVETGMPWYTFHRSEKHSEGVNLPVHHDQREPAEFSQHLCLWLFGIIEVFCRGSTHIHFWCGQAGALNIQETSHFHDSTTGPFNLHYLHSGSSRWTVPCSSFTAQAISKATSTRQLQRQKLLSEGEGSVDLGSPFCR